jgi:hypothetical protein
VEGIEFGRLERILAFMFSQPKGFLLIIFF